MKKENRLYIIDLLEYIDKILRTTKDIDEAEFSADENLMEASLRRIEVIGEIVKRLDDDVKNRYAEIPWRAIAGMRDVIAHDYDGINMRRVWIICQKDIPKLKSQVETILANYGKIAP